MPRFATVLFVGLHALALSGCVGTVGGEGAGGGTAGGTSARAGGSTSGGSTAGGSTAGGSTSGGSTAGGSTSGGPTSGGATSGGSIAGGATAGGSGGSAAGGSTSGGSAGGVTAGGATSGGSAAGGSTSGGATSGGSTSGGSVSGGSTAGGASAGGTAGGSSAGGVAGLWPLSIHASGRYLVHANGTPYIAIGDAPWSLPVNCTDAQILTYLNDRASKGCSAILIEAIEKSYSSQTPRWRNTDGNDPFTVMTPPSWVLNGPYWTRLDFIVNQAAARGIAVFITPAYTGYGNGGDGWRAEYSNATDAALRAYGAALANRYRQGNVVWVMGGDDANDLAAAGAFGSATTPDRTKQWQIVLGLRSVRTTDLITGHTARNQNDGTVNGESYKAWAGYPGWNLNNTYGHDNTDDMVGLADTAWSRPGPIPFFMIEAGYENLDGSNRGGWIPAVQNVLSGGLGGFIAGHDALWHFGSYDPATGAQSVITTYLASSFTDSRNFGQLLRSYPWHLLRPAKDTRLVTTALGSGSNAIVPALATDGSFAFVFSPGLGFTVQLSAITHAQVRARWFDVESGAFTTVAGSPFTNTGTRVFTPSGLRILVLD